MYDMTYYLMVLHMVLVGQVATGLQKGGSWCYVLLASQELVVLLCVKHIMYIYLICWINSLAISIGVIVSFMKDNISPPVIVSSSLRKSDRYSSRMEIAIENYYHLLFVVMLMQYICILLERRAIL